MEISFYENRGEFTRDKTLPFTRSHKLFFFSVIENKPIRNWSIKEMAETLNK